MNKWKRLIAATLCASMIFTMDGMHISAAEQQGSETVTTETTVEQANATEVVADTEVEAPTEAEAPTEVMDTTEQIADTEETKETEKPAEQSVETNSPVTYADQQVESSEQTAEPIKQDAVVAANMRLQYLVVGSPYVETPGEQYVLAGIGDGTYRMQAATLRYRNVSTGQEYEVVSNTIDADSTLFTMNYPDQTWTGSYEITAIDYVVDEVTYTIDVTQTDSKASFGVNQEVTTNPDATTVSEEELAADDVVITDADGQEMSADQLATAVEHAASDLPATNSVDATGAGNLVIVLDPGHGGSDGGNPGSGLSEDELTLAIAAACKVELDTYSGVTVYMTRATDASVEIEERAEIAKKYGADVLISFHTNAAVETAHGAEVYYPNANYNATAGATGKELAAKVLEKLVALGLYDRGIKIRNSENNTTYADGSLADYYGIIRESKERGFPAIIIEHAFQTNSGDVAGYLNSSEKLKKLGVADATAIAQYYGLTKKGTKVSMNYVKSKSSTAMTLSWDKIQDADGYQIYQSTSKSGSYSRIATVKGETTTSYYSTGLKQNKTYYYKVRAYKGSTKYPFSSVMSAKTIVKISVNSITSSGSGTLVLKWDKVSGVKAYQIYRKVSGGTYAKIATVSGDSNVTYTDKKLSTSKTYYYKIRAYQKQNGVTGYGNFSTETEARTIAKTSITGVVSNEDGMKISWKNIKNAYQYQIYRSTAKKGTYKRIKTVSASKTTYTDTTATADKTYYYKVRTRNRVNGVTGSGSFSAVVTGKMASISKVIYVQSTSATSLKVAWKKVTTGTGYKIYRSTSKNGTYKLVKTITKNGTTSFTDKKLTTAKRYYYKVQVTNKVNGKSGVSKLSSPMAGKTVAVTAIKYVQSLSDKKLKIAWKEVSGASGYVITRSTSKSGKYTTITTIKKGSITSYTDKTVKAAKTYYYKVRATNYVNKKTGYSQYSNYLGGKTVKTPVVSKVQAVSSQSIRLTWTAISKSTGYQIYRSTAEKGTYERIATISAGSTVTYTDAVPKRNTSYFYKIRALNSNNKKTGYSGWSKVVNGKAVAKTKVTLSEGTTGGIKISWKKVSGATKYVIYKRAGSKGSYGKLATITAGSTLSYTDESAVSGTTYYYRVQTYNKVNGVTGSSGYSDAKHLTIKYYNIMGESTITVDQMVDYYNSKIKYMVNPVTGKAAAYPSEYSSKGAKNITAFAKLVLSECKTEGVKAEVVWAQVCNETYFLQFGGDVKVTQCNFAGIGATGNGVPGNTYRSVKEGLRAQVQHLKAYASTDKLVNTCIDDRFQWVVRGTAPYVEWLGIPDNPNTVFNADGTIAQGRGWAMRKGYGALLLEIIRDTKKL